MIILATSIVGIVSSSCCSTLQVTDDSDKELYFIQSELVHGRELWLNGEKTMGYWYDGDSGGSYDWLYGPIENKGTDTSTNCSDAEFACPSDVTKWTRSGNGIHDVSCYSK